MADDQTPVDPLADLFTSHTPTSDGVCRECRQFVGMSFAAHSLHLAAVARTEVERPVLARVWDEAVEATAAAVWAEPGRPRWAWMTPPNPYGDDPIPVTPGDRLIVTTLRSADTTTEVRRG